MNHTKATEVRAAEKYLLGELRAEEAEDFERHYFECAECAEAVEAGNEFIANARAVLGEGDVRPVHDRAAPQARKSRWERLRTWWTLPVLVPAAAAFALAVVSIYQGFVVVPGLRQALESPRVLPAFQLAGVSRGAGTQISVPAGMGSLALAIDVPPDAHFPHYRCVLTAGNHAVFQVTAPAPADGQPITILTPTRTLSAGDYELAVYGLGAGGEQRDKVADSTFHFQLQ